MLFTEHLGIILQTKASVVRGNVAETFLTLHVRHLFKTKPGLRRILAKQHGLKEPHSGFFSKLNDNSPEGCLPSSSHPALLPV